MRNVSGRRSTFPPSFCFEGNMAKEIERKFLVTSETWRSLGVAIPYCQGYLHSDENSVIRVRIQGPEARLTIKGRPTGIVRPEYEYSIPMKDAKELLALTDQRKLVEKNRTKISYKGKVWEVDEFFGKNTGLVVAEIELQSEGEAFEKPAWVGKEISEDARYYNVSLSQHPYSEWSDEEKAQ